jgi:putative endonuclease
MSMPPTPDLPNVENLGIGPVVGETLRMSTYVPPESSMWWPDGRRKMFFVYIMSNHSMTLYTGMTNNLVNRVYAHRHGKSKFTRRYHVTRLVYFETYDRVVDAIAREKTIKGWTRAKKIALIRTTNPRWEDLMPATGAAEDREGP